MHVPDYFVEPHDDSPIPLPDGWEGGAVRHTGGGFWCREFRYEPQKLELMYNQCGSEGFAVQECHYDKKYDSWHPCGDLTMAITIDHPDDVPERDILGMARGVMQAISEGEYDDEITPLAKRGERVEIGHADVSVFMDSTEGGYPMVVPTHEQVDPSDLGELVADRIEANGKATLSDITPKAGEKVPLGRVWWDTDGIPTRLECDDKTIYFTADGGVAKVEDTE